MSLVDYKRDMFVGIDVGQVNDWTTIAAIERVRAVPALSSLHHALHDQAKAEAKAIPTRLDLRHLQRIDRGTLYPRQVAIITELLRHPELRGAQTFVDLTGVGRGPFDMLQEARVRNLHGIMITGSRGEATRQPYGWSVGKAELVNGVQIEMQNGRLGFAEGLDLIDALERELMDFRASINPTGHLSFNAREGQHDDLVLALSYAVFGALRPTPSTDMQVRWAA